MKRFIFLLFAIPLLLSAMGCLSACSDFSDDDGNSSLAKLEHAPPLVREAQVLLSKRPVRPVDTHSGDHVPATVTRQTRSAVQNEQFSIDWENYRIVKQHGEDVVLFPLSRKSQTAYVELTENGRTRKAINKVQSKLIVRRDTVTHGLTAVVGTYLCRKDYAKRQKQTLDTLGYDFRGTDYSGYFIASRLDGTMLSGTRYVKGEEHFSFEANASLPEERDTTEVDDELHLYLDLKPATVETRATTVDDVDVEDVSNFRCSFCNQLYMNCQCVSITVCRYCRKRKSECTCTNNPSDGYCTVCNTEIVHGRCNCCAVCKNYPCRCNSNSGDNGNSGNSGNQGGTSGGSSSGGSSSGGGSTSGSGNNQGGGQSPSSKTSVATLRTAANKALADIVKGYGRSAMACNRGVQAMFKYVYGESNLPPGMTGLANEMAQAWAANPQYWHEISMHEAQRLANEGYFVVAGYCNPYGAHGHVVVIVPGREEAS